MLYAFHEFQRSLLSPALNAANMINETISGSHNPLYSFPWVRAFSANVELFSRLTQRYTKPEWEIDNLCIDGKIVSVTTEVVVEQPFCKLIHFKKNVRSKGPKVLIVAPLSGHFATLLRDTVRTALADHDVWVTDWTDAKMVPLSDGSFSLDDYVNYVKHFIQLLSPTTSRERMKKIIKESHDMIYYISMLSTTGRKLKISPKKILQN